MQDIPTFADSVPISAFPSQLTAFQRTGIKKATRRWLKKDDGTS
jgi:hypothetical protein